MQRAASGRATRLQLVLAFAAIYVLWSSTFLAIRYAVAEIPPLLTIAIRCAAGAGILFAWQAARGQLTRPTGAQLRTALLAGTVLFLGGHGLLAWAEQRVTSGQAALWMTTTPLWIVAIGAWLERRAPSPRVLAAVAIGAAGVAILVLGAPEPRAIQAGASRAGDSVALERAALAASAMFWAVGSLIGRHGARPASAIDATALQLAGGALVVCLLSASTGELAGWSTDRLTARGIGALAFLIIGGTVLGFGAYTFLLAATSPVAASTYAFVNPVLALALGWAVGDEPFSPLTAAAGVLVIGAVVMTHLSSAGSRTIGKRITSAGAARAVRRALRPSGGAARRTPYRRRA
ncbi:MAG TPA: EamA family transporter [Gemmatimonadaceae bacterium]|nr:EamA family transporter [Gemmatimonadaceae bacterium]